MTIKYVCGFAFASDRAHVLLIEKNRPDWQAGRLNGVGGHVEEVDLTPRDAMVREFKEETGIDTDLFKWERFATLFGVSQAGEDWLCYFYRALDVDAVWDAKSLTDEQVQLVHIHRLPRNVLPNLRWLLPLSLDDNALRDYTTVIGFN